METQESTNSKNKTGAFLSKKGMAIGTAIGTSLVIIGSVLEEQTSWFVGFFNLIKAWFGL